MDSESDRILVRRTARLLTAGALEGPLHRVWLLLHGYGRLASEFLSRARAPGGERALLVAPEGHRLDDGVLRRLAEEPEA